MGIKRGINQKLPEIGKIKIGSKDEKPRSGKNGKWYAPKRLEHFIVVRPDRDKAKINFIPDEDVMAEIGNEPKKISILLPFDDPDLVFQTSFAFYAGRQCLCRGDGVEASMTFLKDGKPKAWTLLDTEELGESVMKNERRKIVCDPDLCPNRQPDASGNVKCKPTGRLCCIIPASGRLNGYYFFRTTSSGTIGAIMQALKDMKEQTGGILRGIPAKLFFSKRATMDHGNVPLVTIDWDFDQIQQMRQAALEERKARTEFGINVALLENKAKESGILEDKDDPEEVEREFYPHNSREIQESREEQEKDITNRADSVLDDIHEVEETETITQESEVIEVSERGEIDAEIPEDDKNGELDIF